MMEPSATEAAALAAELTRAREAGDLPAAREQWAASIEALFEAHSGRVYATCLRYVGEPEVARELAQEVLLVGFSKLPEFEGRSSFAGWLFGIARKVCVGWLRRRKDLLVDDGLIEAADPTSSILTSLRRQERDELLQAAAETVLTPLEQEAVYLRYVEQIPVEEIDALLGLESRSGARGLLQRCRRKLERELRRRLDELGLGSSFLRPTP